jgi:hypothetical protein
MNEQHKLAEARYFLSWLEPSSSDPQKFSFELSAFLSAARSALQYALDEAKTKPGGQTWYDNHVQQLQSIKYFKGKRDISIHVEPVVPNKHINVTLTASVSIHESLNLKLIDHDGNVIEERNVSSPEPEATMPSSSSVSVSYRFVDWAGPEDVETLCHQYFVAVESVIKDGHTKTFLSQ